MARRPYRVPLMMGTNHCRLIECIRTSGPSNVRCHIKHADSALPPEFRCYGGMHRLSLRPRSQMLLIGLSDPTFNAHLVNNAAHNPKFRMFPSPPCRLPLYPARKTAAFLPDLQLTEAATLPPQPAYQPPAVLSPLQTLHSHQPPPNPVSQHATPRFIRSAHG